MWGIVLKKSKRLKQYLEMTLKLKKIFEESCTLRDKRKYNNIFKVK